MVGSRGLDHMKSVIQEAKDKQKKSVDMSPDEMKMYWKRIDAERERYIQKTQREIKRYFENQQAKLMKQLKGASAFEAERITDQVVTATSKDLRNILIAMNRAVIDHFGKQQYNDLRREKMHNKAFEAYTDDLLYWITVNVGNAVVLIDDTTRAEIKNIIMMGINAGWAIGDEETPDTIAYAIGQLYLDQIIPNRSETIARTETMTAANKGSLSGAQQAESEFGARLLKIWIPTQDGDTRDTHAEMSSHPAIALTAKFRVGQSQGEYPADWELSARERINCRCAVGYVRERETEV